MSSTDPESGRPICPKCGRPGWGAKERKYEGPRGVHSYWDFIHPIRKNGRPTTEKCYLGKVRPVGIRVYSGFFSFVYALHRHRHWPCAICPHCNQSATFRPSEKRHKRTLNRLYVCSLCRREVKMKVRSIVRSGQEPSFSKYIYY